jgi:hypothetical protein
MARGYYRGRFGGGRRRTQAAVKVETFTMPASTAGAPKHLINKRRGELRLKTKCAHCGGAIHAGESAVMAQVRKAARTPCSSCGQTPTPRKYFHASCVPADLNKAMGVSAAPGAATGGAVPPPPKPMSVEEHMLNALATLEAALVAKVQKQGITPELEKAFSTFQGIKARVLRPGTAHEGDTATSIALQKIIKMVFA